MVTIVATFGVWDLFHVGHLNFLEKAKDLGHLLVVGVASDKIVAIHKGRIPVVSCEDRQRIIKALRCADIVVPYSNEDFTDILEQLHIDILAVGEYWGNLKEHEKIKDYILKRGKITTIPYTRSISSKEVRQRLFDRLYRTESEY